jgi:hypothetical protein
LYLSDLCYFSGTFNVEFKCKEEEGMLMQPKY